MNSTVNISARFANMSFICSLMVVLIHVFRRPLSSDGCVSYLRMLLEGGICRVAVPFFFFAAGYFIARHLEDPDSWRNEVLKRIKSLIIPFYIWSGVAFVLCSVLILVANLMGEHESVFSVQRITCALGINPFYVPELRPLWFVRVLFVFVLLLPCFKYFFSKRIGILILAITYLFIKPWIGRICGPRVFVLVNYGLFSIEGALYFSLGIYFAREGIERFFQPKRFSAVFLVIGLVLVAFGSAVRLAIPMLMYWILLHLPDKPIMWCKGYSFPIYLIHLNVIFVYFFCLDKLLSRSALFYFDPGVSCLGAFVCFCIIAGMSFGLAYLFHMFRKKSVVKLMFGGRL